MFHNVSDKLTKTLIENATISEDDYEIYRYGIQQGLTIIMNLATTMLIGVVCKMIWQSWVFTVAYIPLRSFAGGYHARTPFRCYIFSSALILAVLLAMKNVLFTVFVCGIMLSISSFIIILLAPVEDQNKPLDEKEQIIYRKKALMILAFELKQLCLCQWFASCIRLILLNLSLGEV